MTIDDVTGSGDARSTAVRVLLIGSAVLAGALLQWAAVAGALGLWHLSASRAAVTDLMAQLDDGDAGAAADTLRSLQRHSTGVDRWLGGAPWSWGTGLPVVGDTLAATTTLAGAFGEIVPPLAPAAAAVLEAPADDMASVAAAVQQQSAGFIAAGEAAARIEPEVAALDSGAVLGPLAGPIANGQRQLANALPAVTGMAAASVLLPGLIGVTEPTEWVLVASQPAEARGSGAGFFGAYGVMAGDGAGLRLVDARPNNDVYYTPADLTVLPAEFERLWGQSAAFIWGHNLTRHFPYAAQLLAQSTASRGVSADYVVALDPRIVAGLLAVTGPVTAAGLTIDASNAEEFLTNGIYRQFPRAAEKDEAALQVMSAVLQALQTADLEVGRLVSALAEPLRQQRLVAWAADPEQERIIALSAVSGAVPDDPLTLTAAINNAGGNKLDAYLDSEIQAALEGPCRGPATGSVAVTLTMDDVPRRRMPSALDGVVADGGNRTMVHIYGPPGAELLSFTVDGQPAVLTTGAELGRPVWGAEIDLLPGQPRTVAAVFRSDLPEGSLRFLPQPMIRDTAVSLRDERLC